MALLVMSSTLSYSFAKHYCGEHLVDVTLFGEVNGCGMDMNEGLSDNSCCKFVVDLVEGQDELSLEKTAELTIEVYELPTAVIIGNGVVCQGSGQVIQRAWCYAD